jgi:hypothetical protein
VLYEPVLRLPETASTVGMCEYRSLTGPALVPGTVP